MRGDFSRDTFEPLRHYSRVLQLQGQVQLDAHGNERESIQLHHLRTLARDLIGPQGGPGTGFKIDIAINPDTQADLPQDFVIRQGHYYVDGWLCENDSDALYSLDKWGTRQPWLPNPVTLEKNKSYLVYLDVFERYLSASQVDGDVAFAGRDMPARAQVAWQVKVSEDAGVLAFPGPFPNPDWSSWMQTSWLAWRALWQPQWRGQMRAKAADITEADATTPCVISPQSRYRGLENQLYRIEIHRGGVASDKLEPPTFVWSRENGSVVFPVAHVGDRSVTLAEGWRDARFAVATGDIVELTDDDTALSGAAGSLLRVTGVDLDTLTVNFDTGSPPPKVDVSRHALLTRWDHGRRKDTAGATGTAKATTDVRPAVADDLALTLTEGIWLTVEDGITVRFDPAAAGGEQHYRTADYWLVPARTATADVLWPRNAKREPLPQPPRGVDHHYAPLGLLQVDNAGVVTLSSEPPGHFMSLVELTNRA